MLACGPSNCIKNSNVAYMCWQAAIPPLQQTHNTHLRHTLATHTHTHIHTHTLTHTHTYTLTHTHTHATQTCNKPRACYEPPICDPEVTLAHFQRPLLSDASHSPHWRRWAVWPMHVPVSVRCGEALRGHASHCNSN